MRLFRNEKTEHGFRAAAATVLSVTAAALVLTVSVPKTLAYFTTYVTAKGGYTLSLGETTTVHEDFKDWKKTIRLENTGKRDCYVRAKVLAGADFTITASGTDWSQGEDGYWYYAKVVAVGEQTDSLTAAISYPADQERSFNVAVIQECVPVSYDADGNAIPATAGDWARAAEFGEEADQ